MTSIVSICISIKKHNIHHPQGHCHRQHHKDHHHHHPSPYHSVSSCTLLLFLVSPPLPTKFPSTKSLMCSDVSMQQQQQHPQDRHCQQHHHHHHHRHYYHKFNSRNRESMHLDFVLSSLDQFTTTVIITSDNHIIVF